MEYKQNNDEWEIFNYDTSTDISLYNKINNDMTMISSVIVSSIRNKNNGYCYDINNNRIFQFGNNYQLRLRILSEDQSETLPESESINVITNTITTSGSCSIQYNNNSFVLDQFNLNCNGFSHANSSLQYNALMNNILLSSQFVNDPKQG